jgi:hypothetical protein
MPKRKNKNITEESTKNPAAAVSLNSRSDLKRDMAHNNLPKATFGSLSSDRAMTDVVDFLKHIREGV